MSPTSGATGGLQLALRGGERADSHAGIFLVRVRRLRPVIGGERAVAMRPRINQSRRNENARDAPGQPLIAKRSTRIRASSAPEFRPHRGENLCPLAGAATPRRTARIRTPAGYRVTVTRTRDRAGALRIATRNARRSRTRTLVVSRIRRIASNSPGDRSDGAKTLT